MLKSKGPIFVSGVGNTTVRVNDEWMCSVPLTDGSRVVLEGCAVDNITNSLPVANVKEAEKAVKDSDPNNKELQSLKCAPTIGGEVDILLGMQYIAFFQ